MQGDRREGVLDNFVERIRFCHNPKVHDDWIIIWWLEKLQEKTFENIKKKSVPNNDTQQIFVPNNDIQQFFVPNNDSCYFCS